MSQKKYSNIREEVNNLLYEIRDLTNDEIQQFYGIEIGESGEVFDPTYSQRFRNINEWAIFSAEQDQVEYSEHFEHKADLSEY